MAKMNYCIDAGSEYCPCSLAETHDCISCSQLNGKDCCDCMWNGVCIYHEFLMNGKKKKQNRQTYKGSILSRKNIGENLTTLKIETDEKLVKELNNIGSYVFIRSLDSISYFDTPMSIISTEEKNCINIAYQKIGVKTKTLDKTDELFIRGPYWNGVIGGEYLRKVYNSNCLIIARGIGQSNIIPIMRELKNRNNNIFLILDKGKLDSNFILRYMNMHDIKIIELNAINESGINIIKNIISENSIKLVYSGGSDLLNRKVSAILKTQNSVQYFMTTNNSIMCCGEGICGSCKCKTKDGEKIKMCKSKVNPKKIY